ncbi:MAG TPA: hypothetical protein VND68_03155, partial [Chloroflexia bacterium]|nr:hypothetical protein [Chloroflexia bacterium]
SSVRRAVLRTTAKPLVMFVLVFMATSHLLFGVASQIPQITCQARPTQIYSFISAVIGII